MPSPSQNFTTRVYHGARGTRPTDPREPREPDRADPQLAALEGLAVFMAAAALFVLLGALAGPGLGSLAIAQIGGLAGVPIAWAFLRNDPRARLGLAAPPRRVLVGAALLGVSIWYVDIRLAEPFLRAVTTPAATHDELAHLAATFAAPSFVLRLGVVALLPALCEELATRGVLARALRPGLGRIAAVVISALCFATFHLSIVRFVPTLALGVVLASLTLAADSIWPAVLAHFLNNAIALAVVDGELAPITSMVSNHPDIALIASAVLSVAGLVIGLAPRPAA